MLIKVFSVLSKAGQALCVGGGGGGGTCLLNKGGGGGSNRLPGLVSKQAVEFPQVLANLHIIMGIHDDTLLFLPFSPPV